MEAQLIIDTGAVRWVATAAHTGGQIVAVPDGRTGVMKGLKASAIGDTVEAYTANLFEVASASGTTFAVGAPVYFDETTRLAVAVVGSNLYLGPAVKAKVSGELVVLIDLNVGAITAVS
jgi:predicted RecA/RadA family phage recombinase